MATLYFVQGRFGEVEPLLQRWLAIKEKILGTEHPDLALSLENYAEFLRAMGRAAEAAKMEARAAGIRAATQAVE